MISSRLLFSLSCFSFLGRPGLLQLWQPVSQLKGFPGSSAVTNPSTSAGDAGDVGSIPGMGRSPEKTMATHSSILAWEIPWTEEPGGLQSMGLQRVGHD